MYLILVIDCLFVVVIVCFLYSTCKNWDFRRNQIQFSWLKFIVDGSIQIPYGTILKHKKVWGTGESLIIDLGFSCGLQVVSNYSTWLVTSCLLLLHFLAYNSCSYFWFWVIPVYHSVVCCNTLFHLSYYFHSLLLLLRLCCSNYDFGFVTIYYKYKSCFLLLGVIHVQFHRK